MAVVGKRHRMDTDISQRSLPMVPREGISKAHAAVRRKIDHHHNQHLQRGTVAAVVATVPTDRDVEVSVRQHGAKGDCLYPEVEPSWETAAKYCPHDDTAAFLAALNYSRSLSVSRNQLRSDCAILCLALLLLEILLEMLSALLPPPPLPNSRLEPSWSCPPGCTGSTERSCSTRTWSCA